MKTAAFKQLIEKYLAKEATAGEEQLIDQWYTSFPEKSEQEIFTSSADKKRIEQELYTSLNGLWTNLPVQRHLSRRFYWPYAACIVLLLASVFLFLNHKQHTAETPHQHFNYVSSAIGQVKKITLPDQTVVWLNAGTKIHIPSDFTKNTTRQLYLDEGEMYLDVAQDPQHPFTVFSDQLSIKVLGTSFNIRNYKTLHAIKIAVASGKVAVLSQQQLLEELQANQALQYNRTTHQYHRFDQAPIDKGWTAGKIALKEADFQELALQVHNLYGVKLIAKNPALFTYRFNLTIRSSRSIEETIKLICSVHQNQYRRENNEISIY